MNQILSSRWFPTPTPHLLAGVLASAVTYGLHALGVIAPADLAAAVTPIAGLLTAAVVHKPAVAVSTPSPPATLGSLIGTALQVEIDRNPKVLSVATDAVLAILKAPTAPITHQMAGATRVVRPTSAAVQQASRLQEGFISEPSPPAPHIEQ